VLLCNKPDLADELLSKLEWKMPAQSIARLARMHGAHHPHSMTQLRESNVYVDAVKRVAMVGHKEGDLFA
jgi:beta-N-acetylhexosaminidase